MAFFDISLSQESVPVEQTMGVPPTNVIYAKFFSDYKSMTIFDDLVYVSNGDLKNGRIERRIKKLLSQS